MEHIALILIAVAGASFTVACLNRKLDRCVQRPTRRPSSGPAP